MANVRSGDIIRLLEYDPPKAAQVIDALSTQFTAQYMDGTHTLTFLFYRDEGDTWKRTEGDGS